MNTGAPFSEFGISEFISKVGAKGYFAKRNRYTVEIDYYNKQSEIQRDAMNEKIDVRFLGDDYRDKSFTGDDLDIPIHYLDRSHGWSTTKFKKLIAETL